MHLWEMEEHLAQSLAIHLGFDKVVMFRVFKSKGSMNVQVLLLVHLWEMGKHPVHSLAPSDLASKL
jgi:hypothetical protein